MSPMRIVCCLPLILFALLPGCVNVGSQKAKTSITRLVTVPEGARVYILRLNLGGMITPVDLPDSVLTSDTIRIQKAGYLSWEGRLAELWQEAEGCYIKRLKKKG